MCMGAKGGGGMDGGRGGVDLALCELINQNLIHLFATL